MEAPKTVFEEDKRPSKELRVLAAVSYVPLGFILPYALGKNDEDFVIFHLRQAITMFAITFFAAILLGGFFWFFYLVIAGYTGYRAYEGDKFIFGFILKAKELIEGNENDKK